MRFAINKKRIINSIKYRLLFISFAYRFYLTSRRKNSVILLGTPIHGNIGDQAIAYAENILFADLNLSVAEIPSPFVSRYMNLWKKIVGNKPVFVHGGGFIGTLWPDEHKMLEDVLDSFKENPIIILPQTIDFENNIELLEHFNKKLSQCNEVTICVREEISLQKYKKYIPSAKLVLVPDMVLYLNSCFSQKMEHEHKAIFCIRSDKEKKINCDTIEKLKAEFSIKAPNLFIDMTDMIINITVKPGMRKKIVYDKIKEFSKAELLVTDRLHGMVLGMLAGVPVAVFSNLNHKVDGVYRWISENSMIIRCDSAEQVIEFWGICSGLENKGTNSINLTKQFEVLKELVKQYV